MKLTRFNRIFAALLAMLLLWASVPAQIELGGRRMVHRDTPTLTNRNRLPTVLGPRPRIGYVRRIGGISSDGVAAPEQGLILNSIVPSYSATRPDGQRLSIAINGRTVTAPIYDWQLIPIAKFANSGSFACYTLFGSTYDGPNNSRQEDTRGEDDSRYHPDFKDTLVGLRLFQLDSLLFDPDATDLFKEGNKYILGHGESAPNLTDNRKGLKAFREYLYSNKDLLPYESYVISDYRRRITFGIDENRLSIKGEPYVYFWRIDPEAELKFDEGEAEETVLEALGSSSKYTKAALINLLLREAAKYDQITDGTGFLNWLLTYELEEIVIADKSERMGLLRTQTHAALFDFLVELRVVNSLEWTIEMRELSDKVSNETAMLRAINPAVWDTGVNLIRYAAFFRYIKKQKPKQWQAFIRQINAAPPPQPPVSTPSGFERPTRSAVQ